MKDYKKRQEGRQDRGAKGRKEERKEGRKEGREIFSPLSISETPIDVFFGFIFPFCREDLPMYDSAPYP